MERTAALLCVDELIHCGDVCSVAQLQPLLAQCAQQGVVHWHFAEAAGRACANTQLQAAKITNARRNMESRIPMNRDRRKLIYSIYNLARRRRRALVMTLTELRLMAALAIIGLSSQPKSG
jgi:hypothetical protein